MNLHIKNKFKLIDLAQYGTQARKYVKPNVLISEGKDGMFDEGDLVDGNIVYRLIQDAIKDYMGNVKVSVLTREEYDVTTEHDPGTIYLIEAV